MSEPVRILIVEDVPSDFELAQHEIRKAVPECVFQRVETRADFLRALETFQPDLILSDYTLPHFDGLTALQLAQEHAKLTPFIIWTGTTGEDITVELMRAGAVNYILKDNLKRLGPAVAHALEEGHVLREHEQAAEAIRNNEKRFRALIENSRDNISLLAMDGTLLWESPATIRSLGYAQDEFVGRNIFELMHPDDLQWTSELYARLLQEPGSRADGIVRLRHNDGSWRWNEATVSNMLNEPGVNAIVVNYRDITERKQAEMERQVLLEIMQGLVNTDDLHEFLKLIHHSIARVIYAENFFVVFYNKDSGLFEEVYSVDQYDEPSPPSALEKSITSYVFRSGEPLLLTQARFDQLAEQGEVELVGTDSASWLGAPLQTPNGTIGVLAVQDYEDPNRYTERDKDFLALIGSQVAIAIERKKVEEELAKQQDLLNAMLDTVPDHIYFKDTKSRFIRTSKSQAAAFGLSDPAQAIGKTDFDFFTEEHARPAYEAEQEIIRTGQPFSKEEGETWPNRPDTWVMTTKMPLRNQQGEIIGTVGISKDITERKRVEEALRQSENRYSLASKATNDVIWEWDQQTNQLFWNENAQAVFGYPPEEIGSYATWWEEHIHAEDRERVLLKLNALIAEDETIWEDEYRFLRRDGSYAFIIDRAYVERDASGKPLRVIGAMSDITERKRADEQLKYHARLLRHINDAVIATDDQFRITAWNRAAEKMYGWHSKEVMGHTVSEILSFELTAEQRAEASELMKKSMASRSEVIHQHRDGQTLYVESNTIALLNEHGRMMGYVSVNRDITERKRAEKALHQREEQYRSLFEDSPISLWVEDFSAVKQRLDELRGKGIVDLPAYFREHPHFVTEMAGQVRILDVNNAALKLYHARQKSELLGNLAEVFNIVLPEQFETELIQIAQGRLNFEREQVDQTLTGEEIHVSVRWTVAPGYEDSLAQVIISTVDITERKQAEEQIQLQLQRVRALRAIDIAISSSFDLHLTLNILLDHVLAQLHTDAAAILTFHPSTRTLEYAAGRGFRSTTVREARLAVGQGYAGKSILERRMIHISNLVETDRELAALSLKTENFIEYYCVPLIVKGEVKGVLEIFHRSLLADDPEWVDFLETLAGQAAIAIDNAALFENVQHSNRELFQAYDATIEGWSHALDLRDKETEGHTLRVTEMTMELARKFGFTDEQLRYVRWGALLHDIGKMGVPDNILLKPDKLTDEEWERMRLHPVFAFEMLSPIAYLKPSLDIPYCHHEKWDGTGYPRGLKGEVIPLAARLFAIVDVWDALRSDRPYRNAWSVEKTVEHIKSLSGTHFDPKVVEYFLEMIE